MRLQLNDYYGNRVMDCLVLLLIFHWSHKSHNYNCSTWLERNRWYLDGHMYLSKLQSGDGHATIPKHVTLNRNTFNRNGEINPRESVGLGLRYSTYHMQCYKCLRVWVKSFASLNEKYMSARETLHECEWNSCLSSAL